MVQSHMIQSKVSESLCHCLYMVSSVIALWKLVVFFMAYALGCLHCFWMAPEGLCLAIAFYPRCLGNQWSSL
ncbi:hypothetical protein MUCCIDRAFT_155803 [Mucor lusitanicus CBS 277.49]|uniref:Uncharacterized protein n=2 Tax=Mucor circinelloides f. lusitanicus TaxID=29924 RepID=A0A168MLG2_MUCCL|nr:hypothetical protein MUCCIDRAFT_155803 [Mucor lusitanicus CBS 277.49]